MKIFIFFAVFFLAELVASANAVSCPTGTVSFASFASAPCELAGGVEIENLSSTTPTQGVTVSAVESGGSLSLTFSSFGWNSFGGGTDPAISYNLISPTGFSISSVRASMAASAGGSAAAFLTQTGCAGLLCSPTFSNNLWLEASGYQNTASTFVLNPSFALISISDTGILLSGYGGYGQSSISSFSDTFTVERTAATPEPTTLLITAVGLGVLVSMRRK